MAQQDPRSGVFHEISSLLLKILRSPPPPVPFSDHVLELSSVISSSSSRILPSSQMTPAGFAALLLGISLALMLCGSVTFFLGFMLMPWILVLVMIFYVVGIVSSLSVLGRSLICCFTAPTPRKDFHGELLIYPSFLVFIGFDSNLLPLRWISLIYAYCMYISMLSRILLLFLLLVKNYN